MLVLKRHKDEWIDIAGGTEAGGVSIVVVEIKGDKVKIGIDARREMSVHRREVTEAIKAEEEKVVE